MKIINIRFVLLCFLAIIMMASCKKSEYLTDGGVHTTTTTLSKYDYLAQHSWASFDTLIAIIDHYNLKEEVNAAPTFFAVTDYSIKRYITLKDDSVKAINENNKYTLENMYNDISADSIRQYMFSQKIELESSATAITPFNSLGKTTCAVQKFLQTDASYYTWASTPVYSLYYIKVRGGLDDPNNPPSPTDPNYDSKVICQTTGIGTNSGATVLHVLTNAHVFVRF